jgi:hypothetical protein
MALLKIMANRPSFVWIRLPACLRRGRQPAR